VQQGGEQRRDGSRSSSFHSGSGDRTSESYRDSPEYEWNGWEKVYRGKKIRGPAMESYKKKDTASQAGEPTTSPANQQGAVSSIRSPERPSQPSPSGIRVPIAPPVVSGVAAAGSAPLGSDKGSMDWTARRGVRTGEEVQSVPCNPQGITINPAEVPGIAVLPHDPSGVGDPVPTSQSSSPKSSSTATQMRGGDGPMRREKVGESLLDPLSVQVDGSIDVNRNLVSETHTESMVFGSIGEASIAFPPQLRVATQGRYPASLTTTPRTPLTTPSGSRIPDHLQAEFMEWMRTRYTTTPNGGFLTPQARKLSTLDSARRRQEISGSRRQDITESARRQRSSLLLSKRNTPSGGADGQQEGDEEASRGVRGQLFLQDDVVTLPPPPP
jgi:hypothetical protein